VKDWASLVVHRFNACGERRFYHKMQFFVADAAIPVRSTDCERLEKVAFAFGRLPLVPLGRRALLLAMRAEGCVKITSSLRDGEEFW
jgi:hypothetical protein